MSRFFRLILAVGLLPLVLSLSFPVAAAPRASSSPSPRLLTSSVDTVSFDVALSTDDLALETVNFEGTEYIRVSFPDAAFISEPGQPELPYLSEMLGVPFGAEVQISASASAPVRIPLDAPVLPAPSQEVISDWESLISTEPQAPQVRESRLPDSAIYAAREAFPQELAKTLNDGVIRQQRVLSVGVYPLQYLPAENALLLYENVRVEVRFHASSVDSLQAARPESAEYEQLLANHLLNYTQAKTLRRFVQPAKAQFSAAQLNAAGGKSWTPPDPGWRISTNAEGFYQISASELSAAGVPVESIAPENYHMFHLGEEIAIQVSPQDDILFYAEALESKYTADNVYWLSYDSTPGLRMETRDAAPGAQTLVTSFLREEHYEIDAFYRPKSPAEDEYEHYFWNSVYRSGASRANWVRQLDLSAWTGGDLSLSLPLIGYSSATEVNPDHRAGILINGTQVYDGSWDAFTLHQADLMVPAALLIQGTNTLTVTALDTSYEEGDLFWVDWVDIGYSGDFQTAGNTLKFSQSEPGDWKFELTNFSTADALVFDISDPHAPAELTGGTYSGAGLYALQFHDEVATASAYLAFTPDNLLDIKSITLDTPSALATTSHQADYLVISHANFLAAAQPLEALREADGLETELFDLQDIYDEFSYGIIDPAAIRSFIAYAYAQWQAPAPNYVLLVGDGTYDPKNHENHGRTSFLPPYMAFVDRELGETAADNRYVSIVGEDAFPELMLGRLAVNQPSEVTAYLDKVASYQANPPAGDMLRRILAITSRYEYNAQFPVISDELLRDEFPGEPYTAQKVYWKWTHTDLAQARADIQSGINEGRLLVNYIGHGYYAGWGDTNALLFLASDISSLQNQDKYPFVMAMTCMDGLYTYPLPYSSGYEAMAEIVTRTALKGAIASWSPTGWGMVTGHDLLNRGAFHAIFESGTAELGGITQAGLLRVWSSGENQDLLETYLLFGDPAVRLPRSLTAVPDFYTGTEDTQLVVDEANGVLSNDIRPDGAELTAILVNNALYGSVTLNPDGSFSYLPDPDYCGEDSFSYKINDGTMDSNTVLVRLLIDGVNDHAPVAYDQSVSTLVGTSISITLQYSDSDECGGISACVLAASPNDNPKFSYSFEIVTPPGHGTLSGTGPVFEYTPEASYLGEDSFAFKVNDGIFDSNTAQVDITIEMRAVPDLYGTAEDIELIVDAVNGVLNNDIKPDSIEFAAILVDEPFNGSITLNPDGSFIYAPDLDFCGQDSFTYKISDGTFESNTALVELAISGDNDHAPIAYDQDVLTLVDTPVNITLEYSDSDECGGSSACFICKSPDEGAKFIYTFEIVDPPAHGTLDGTGPIVEYSPAPGYFGPDSFTFKVNDGLFDSNTAQINITVVTELKIFLPILIK